MIKISKIVTTTLILVEGMCAAIVVDESLKKVDTIPKWVLGIGRSTITVLITGLTLFAAGKSCLDSTTEDELAVSEPTEDDDEEFEFEDDLD